MRVSEHELSEIRVLIEERSGIWFDESRERFFSARVREHCWPRALNGGTEFLRAARKTNVEYEALLERLLTQETTFFRYPAVYEAFQKSALPELHVKKFWKNPRTLRIWSAGCSTGEEPYSIAITVADALTFADAWNVEILATDVGRAALQARRTRSLFRPQHFERHGETDRDSFHPAEDGQQVKPRLRKMVTFTQMNWPPAVYVGRMDVHFLHERADLFLRRAAAITGAAVLRHPGAGRVPFSGAFRVHF